jgi:hypothetical protein
LLNVITGLHAGGVAASTNSYESIATVTVGSGGSSTVTFSSIPSTYKHLQIRAMGADTGSGLYDFTMRFNSDSAANYAGNQLNGNGSTTASSTLGGTPPVSTMYPFYTTGTNSGASSIFGVMVLDLLDYANTNKNKVWRSLSGSDSNGSGIILLRSGLWISTSAVTNIAFTTTNNFAQYSSFALYGVK